jgi:hypothetical protein
MNLKISKYRLFFLNPLVYLFQIFIFALLFTSFSVLAHADGSDKHQIILEKFGSVAYSQITYEKKSFNSVIVQSDQAIRGLMVNFDPLNGGTWEPVVFEDDSSGKSALLFTSPSNSAQFRIEEDASDKIVLNTEFIFAEDDKVADTDSLLSGPVVASSDIKVISRAEWGADESLRYWSPDADAATISSNDAQDYSDSCADFANKYKDELGISRTINTGPNGEHLLWPLAYSQQIKKIVIHHTDSELKDLNGDNRMDGLDYKAMIRAIYHFHAVTRGWGDIGYNYIIDPMGNIYEGRAGGEKVIGAHARCYNNGSIGISVIGNYEDNDIPEPALNSLIALIAQKSKLYNIDTLGTSLFRGKDIPNILGHKDVGSTSCPGKNLYALLPEIRERADLLIRTGVFSESSLSSQTLDYNADSLTSVPVLSMLPNERRKVTLRFKNTGAKAWDRNTWLHVSLNNKEGARIIPIIEDKAFVAANMAEDSVAPGQTATFEVQLESGYFAGNYDFEVAPVVNGRYKISRSSVTLSMQIASPKFDYSVVSKDLPSGIVFQGQKIQAHIILKNTGNVTWVNYGLHPMRIGTEAPRDRKSPLLTQYTTRLAHLIQTEVKPGENGTFLFNLQVPDNSKGIITEHFTPVIENVAWFENKGLGFEIDVREPRHIARILDKTKIFTMKPGEMQKIQLTMQNLGDLAWDQDSMSVALTSTGIKTFKTSLIPASVISPKQQGDFSFWIQAPYSGGKYEVSLKSLYNNTKIITGGTTRFLIDVPAPQFRAQLYEQKLKSIDLNPGQAKQIEVKFKNIGNIVWRNKGENTIYLAPTNPQDRLSNFYSSDDWENKSRAATMLENEVNPGEIGTIRFTVKPAIKGDYKEYFQLVIENVGWIDSSFVRWDFHVSGDKKNTSIVPNKDSSQNSKAAAVITQANKNVIKATNSSASSVVSSEKPFRVKISYADDSSKITADKNFKVLGKNNEILFSVGAGTSASITRSGDNINVSLGSIVKTNDVVRVVPDDGGVVEISTMERRPSWNTALNDNKFRGIIEVRSISSQATYINELPLEDYLKGLAEVSNDTAPEKQKAIAVLARTYARFYMQSDKRKFPGMPYDGSDDPAIFQRYLGYGVESRSANFVNAVAATKDMVVTYNGQLIKTPYFSQSNGRTKSAQEVWGWTDAPYLQSVDDPYCAGMTQSGHGVGMSGCGSDGMAKAGKAYEEIIKYYYQGVKIEKFNLL